MVRAVKTVTLECPVCRADFVIPASRSVGRRGRYCSRRCAGSGSAWDRHGGNVWTPAEDLVLRDLYQAGLGEREIGALLGFDGGNVGRHRRNIGEPSKVERTSWTQQADEALRAFAPFMTHAEIGQLMGVKPRAVRTRMIKLQIQRPASYYFEHGIPYHGYPRDLQHVIRLQAKLKEKLREEEHRRSA